MLLVTVTDLEGRRHQVNGGAIAYFTDDRQGKGAVIAFSSIVNGAFLTMRVAETADAITTQINAKLRK
jgi:hypothetical protein